MRGSIQPLHVLNWLFMHPDDDYVPVRFAAKCTYLQMTMGSHRLGQGLINICRHIVRDGRECVGPFLDDTETTCGLWEAKPGARTGPNVP